MGGRPGERYLVVQVKSITIMGECEFCGSDGSLLELNHGELGRKMVCSECWQGNWKNHVSTASSGEGSAGGCGGSCGI